MTFTKFLLKDKCRPNDWQLRVAMHFDDQKTHSLIPTGMAIGKTWLFEKYEEYLNETAEERAQYNNRVLGEWPPG